MAEAEADIAARLFDAIEAGDQTALGELYAPNALLWSNTTGRSIPATDVIAFLPAISRRFTDRRYVDRRVSTWPGGFVQRHRLIAINRDGARVALDACVVATIEDGRICRIDEYCDARQLAALSS